MAHHGEDFCRVDELSHAGRGTPAEGRVAARKDFVDHENLRQNVGCHRKAEAQGHLSGEILHRHVGEPPYAGKAQNRVHARFHPTAVVPEQRP
ncbi:MAG TPA: hypothetical protein VN812_23545 [Candidatus Acidoferrales bacterium]|nr:hypothetical protein [Candidatus Acidoferrales bacterium]